MVDLKKQSAETFLTSTRSMPVENLLMFWEEMGVEAAKDIRRNTAELRAKAAVGVALERAIKAAQKQNKTKEGRRTWQTLLTAVTFRRPANDDAEEEEEGPTSMSGKAAAIMGVSRKTWSYAVKRVRHLQVGLDPTEAIKNGVYWFWPRAKRSDAASEDLMELMRSYWRDDEVSRTTGNSGDRDMWKESKSRNRSPPPSAAAYRTWWGGRGVRQVPQMDELQELQSETRGRLR